MISPHRLWRGPNPQEIEGNYSHVHLIGNPLRNESCDDLVFMQAHKQYAYAHLNGYDINNNLTGLSSYMDAMTEMSPCNT